jgi:hypothetical protein
MARETATYTLRVTHDLDAPAAIPIQSAFSEHSCLLQLLRSLIANANGWH